MDSVLRATAVFLFLLIIFRVAGRRTLAELTPFDFILLLIISEATQNGMIGDDYSLTNSMVVIITLIGLDVLLSVAKARWAWLGHWLDGRPMILVDHGRPLKERLRRCRIDEEDVLVSARMRHGLERMDQIKYAVLENSGGISIIPK